MVGASHYILGPFGPPSDLRAYGMKLVDRGGRGAKKKAVVAVARKLSVLMLVLLKTGEDYQPCRNTGCAGASGKGSPPLTKKPRPIKKKRN